MLELGRRVLMGPSLNSRFFHPLKPIPSRRRFLAVDASMKVLFDCGGFKVVAVKAAAVVWRRGGLAERSLPKKRVGIVARRREAEEVLLRAELDLASEALERLDEGDYCILDRPLASMLGLREGLREAVRTFSERCCRKGVWLMGVCKSSRLRLDTGEPLMGFLNYLGSKVMAGTGWFYHPLLQLGEVGLDLLGEPVAVKFNHEAPYVFRVDVDRRLASSPDLLAKCLGELAGLQDTATPGLPYPVVGVHEEAKMSIHEVELDRARLLEALRRRGLLERFLTSVRSVSFKEEEMWGGVL